MCKKQRLQRLQVLSVHEVLGGLRGVGLHGVLDRLRDRDLHGVLDGLRHRSLHGVLDGLRVVGLRDVLGGLMWALLSEAGQAKLLDGCGVRKHMLARTVSWKFGPRLS